MYSGMGTPEMTMHWLWKALCDEGYSGGNGVAAVHASDKAAHCKDALVGMSQAGWSGPMHVFDDMNDCLSDKHRQELDARTPDFVTIRKTKDPETRVVCMA